MNAAVLEFGLACSTPAPPAHPRNRRYWRSCSARRRARAEWRLPRRRGIIVAMLQIWGRLSSINVRKVCGARRSLLSP